MTIMEKSIVFPVSDLSVFPLLNSHFVCPVCVIFHLFLFLLIIPYLTWPRNFVRARNWRVNWLALLELAISRIFPVNHSIRVAE